ncbi:hypothetical protein BN7_762 [Wickerhamomyces ciferrii]|uniref:Uncharacterized protein n=1 Tax=Wickerhamomyces ciferrii (strain ATCC 14091 / BCRC 22168 / CBS 111 / JCM 3599 / NBRC 0793 / NRRL Y-1031 F-60-10) TaxID=1206466 RepID=K0K8Q7_WICCF|nr:uncharacterized protein BN7_762 [Wickerhamomyces ciferrii]CCH41225.1 hypothetical protein BN7_762 [Wickerhamomyces ciferrii]
MSQIWNFLQKDNVDYFNHHLQPEQTKHSKESDSTIDGDAENIEQKDESFNNQLKKKLSNLKTQKKKNKRHDVDCENKVVNDHPYVKQDENASCDCLIDEQDDQVNEIVSPIIIKSGTTGTTSQQAHQSIDSHLLSPSSMSTTSSSFIFERNVQDQIQMSNCSLSRRNSSNPLARSQSYSSQSSIPTHLNSEFFIPQVLDATAEVLSDPNYEDIEVIQSNSNHVSSALLDQHKNSISNSTIYQSPNNSSHPGMGNRRMSRSLPISRRQSSCSPLSPISTISNSTSTNPNVDYSDKKKLNFYSFADLLNDETDTGLISPNSPIQNSSTYGSKQNISTLQQLRDPFQGSDSHHSITSSNINTSPKQQFLSSQTSNQLPILSKTSSIKEILLESQNELEKGH